MPHAQGHAASSFAGSTIGANRIQDGRDARSGAVFSRPPYCSQLAWEFGRTLVGFLRGKRFVLSAGDDRVRLVSRAGPVKHHS